MNQKIKTYLTNLETEYNIKILLACETGSRAWGFPSPDSDYDVRIIYVHKHDWYLSLNEAKDHLNLMMDDDLVDISGWDLRKSLRLLAKSNAPLIERIQSPIVYQQECDFIAQITELAQACYSRISSVHHYLVWCPILQCAISAPRNDPMQGVIRRQWLALSKDENAAKGCLSVRPLESTQIPQYGVAALDKDRSHCLRTAPCLGKFGYF